MFSVARSSFSSSVTFKVQKSPSRAVGWSEVYPHSRGGPCVGWALPFGTPQALSAEQSLRRLSGPVEPFPAALAPLLSAPTTLCIEPIEPLPPPSILCLCCARWLDLLSLKVSSGLPSLPSSASSQLERIKVTMVQMNG